VLDAADAEEDLKTALAANLGYYTDDPRELWWLFFAIAQGGFIGSGGVYIKGGSRVLSVKLAQVVREAGGAVRLRREAIAIDTPSDGAPAVVRHVDAESRKNEERVSATAVLANCAPTVLAAMAGEPERRKLEDAYGGRPLSTSLFSAHFGLSASPSKFGLERYSTVVVPDWMTALSDASRSAGLLGEDPVGQMPLFGIANYGAIKSGLSEAGPTLVSIVGTDRFENWCSLSPEAEKDRRARWLDVLLAALERLYPGLADAVTEKVFLNARSMRAYLNTPDGAVYGFAPAPPARPFWAGVPRSSKTPIPGIYLASSFAGAGGFTGAMMAGANAARLYLDDHP